MRGRRAGSGGGWRGEEVSRAGCEEEVGFMGDVRGDGSAGDEELGRSPHCHELVNVEEAVGVVTKSMEILRV